MVMYLAALQDVPKELYESADMDGAGALRKFISITIPGIKPVMMYNVITTMVMFLQYFSQAYVVNNALSPTGSLTMGIPLDSTMFYGSYLYQNAFKYFKMGYSSAMAWILLILSMAATVILFKTSGMLKNEE